MVRRIVNFIHKEVRGLHEAAYLLGLFAIFSGLLALIRDRILTHSFGAGELLDVYYAAFRIPDLIFVSIASLVSVYALIPFLAEKLETSRDEGRRFLSSIFTSFSLLILGVSGLVFFLVPTFLNFFFPGLAEGALYNDLVLLTRVLLIQPILLGVSALYASVTQTYQKFILYAISPLLYNVGIIIGVIFFYPTFGILGLGYGVILGAFMHMAIQVPFIVKNKFFPRFTFAFNFAEVWRVASASIPRTIALSANQVVLLLMAAFASIMAPGSIAIFNLSFHLQSIPISIVAVSYSVAAFPTLAKLFSNGEKEKFFEQVTTAARHIIFWSLPVIALFVVLRAQIVRVILGSGEFDWDDTRLTAAALALFAISIVAQGIVMLLVRGYYASGNTRKPLVVNVVSSALAILFAYILVQLFVSVESVQMFVERLLRVEGLVGTEVLMLPLGFSIAMLINAVVLTILFQKDFRGFSRGLYRVLFQSGISAIAMGFTAYLFLNILAGLVDINTFIGIFSQGFLSGFAGIVVGVVFLKIMGNEEIDVAWRSIRRKFWKAKTIASGEEV